ncbi:MAG: hypothetical protein ACI9EX_000210 [Oleispira sp.]
MVVKKLIIIGHLSDEYLEHEEVKEHQQVNKQYFKGSSAY